MNVSCQTKIEDIISQVIKTYLEENLKVQGQSKQKRLEGFEEDEEDEDENFQKSEKTMQNENIDFFARLMKSKVEDSCKLVI